MLKQLTIFDVLQTKEKEKEKIDRQKSDWTISYSSQPVKGWVQVKRISYYYDNPFNKIVLPNSDGVYINPAEITSIHVATYGMNISWGFRCKWGYYRFYEKSRVNDPIFCFDLMNWKDYYWVKDIVYNK